MTADIKCTNCSTMNKSGSTVCRLCGHPLHYSDEAVRECPNCKSTVGPAAGDKCVSCGWNFAPNPKTLQAREEGLGPEECEASSEAPVHTIRSFNVSLAAIFMMIAGALGILYGLMAVLPGTGEDVLSVFEDVLPALATLDDVLEEYGFVSALLIIFGVLSIALSTTAMNRSSYSGALAGAIFGILSIGFIIGSFFGVMALILLAASKREFLLECD